MHFYEQDKHALRELLTTNKSFVQFAIGLRNQEANPHAPETSGAHLCLQPAALTGKWVSRARPVALPGSQRAGIPSRNPHGWSPRAVLSTTTQFSAASGYEENSLAALSPTCRVAVDAQLPNDETLTLREKMKVTEEADKLEVPPETGPVGLPLRDVRPFWPLAGPRNSANRSTPREQSPAKAGYRELDAKVIRCGGQGFTGWPTPPRVRQVFVRRAFRRFVGRNEALRDASTLRRADLAYVKSPGEA